LGTSYSAGRRLTLFDEDELTSSSNSHLASWVLVEVRSTAREAVRRR
jgi:hypothetical protein